MKTGPKADGSQKSIQIALQAVVSICSRLLFLVTQLQGVHHTVAVFSHLTLTAVPEVVNETILQMEAERGCDFIKLP